MNRLSILMTSKRAISTDAAPKAIGPYSQAVLSGDLLFCSGQVPIDPATGNLVPGGIEEQTRQSLSNLEAVVKAAGASLADVVKTTVYMLDLSQFAAMNAVYATFFSHEAPPARATVGVASLPKGALVEIEAVVRLRPSAA